MSEALALWKTAHILSAAVLFGTGIGIAFFCWFGYRHAVRTGDIGALRSTLRLTVVADAWLTAPAVVFQAVSGVVLMSMFGWPLLSSWSIAVWSLFAFTGACWLPVVWLQLRMRDMAVIAARDGAALPPRYWRYQRLWFGLGLPAFSGLVVVFWLMVFKPAGL